MISNPKATPQNEAAKAWLRGCLARNALVVLPEIADYEVRRELIRDGKAPGLARLDALKATLRFLPIDSQIMLEAAHLWAQARQRGRPATSDQALDGDMILVAQSRKATRIFAEEANGGATVIATTNTKHLLPFADAQEWQEIS